MITHLLNIYLNALDWIQNNHTIFRTTYIHFNLYIHILCFNYTYRESWIDFDHNSVVRVPNNTSLEARFGLVSLMKYNHYRDHIHSRRGDSCLEGGRGFYYLNWISFLCLAPLQQNSLISEEINGLYIFCYVHLHILNIKTGRSIGPYVLLLNVLITMFIYIWFLIPLFLRLLVVEITVYMKLPNTWLIYNIWSARICYSLHYFRQIY